jgi:hypothetical protein
MPWRVRISSLNHSEAPSHATLVAAQVHSSPKNGGGAPKNGGGVRRVTREPGCHVVALDHARERFVDTWSSATAPYRVAVKVPCDVKVSCDVMLSYGM